MRPGGSDTVGIDGSVIEPSPADTIAEPVETKRALAVQTGFQLFGARGGFGGNEKFCSPP